MVSGGGFQDPAMHVRKLLKFVLPYGLLISSVIGKRWLILAVTSNRSSGFAATG